MAESATTDLDKLGRYVIGIALPPVLPQLQGSRINVFQKGGESSGARR